MGLIYISINYLFESYKQKSVYYLEILSLLTVIKICIWEIIVNLYYIIKFKTVIENILKNIIDHLEMCYFYLQMYYHFN